MKKSVFIIILCFVFLMTGYQMVSAAEVNYDTAWSFVYDGGIKQKDKPIWDRFGDVVAVDDGAVICVGTTQDSANWNWVLLLKLDASGKVVWKKQFSRAGRGFSIASTKNNDFIVGGAIGPDPVIVRTDSVGDVRWERWLHDSTENEGLLRYSAIVNSIAETSEGAIICAAGNEYPFNNGQPFENYHVFIALDSTGSVKTRQEVRNLSGYTTGGFSICEGGTKNYLLAGNRTVLYLNRSGTVLWEKKYVYMLEGVGSTENLVHKVKVLRDGSLMAMGLTYEDECWEKYSELLRDAWWSQINYQTGAATTRNTAGVKGRNDILRNFTQLINGNIVFVGKKSNMDTANGGVWVIVTDSTGNTVLFERQFKIPYKTANGLGPDPMGVCATPDSGFTVVGEYACNNDDGAYNAFAAHFTPVPPVSTSREKKASGMRSLPEIRQTGRQIIFSAHENHTCVTIYNAAGEVVSVVRRRGDLFVWDAVSFAGGVYFFRLTGHRIASSGSLLLH